ncbi:3950_t:CDS:2, partial [Diversispora eburnea]
ELQEIEETNIKENLNLNSKLYKNLVYFYNKNNIEEIRKIMKEIDYKEYNFEVDTLKIGDAIIKKLSKGIKLEFEDSEAGRYYEGQEYSTPLSNKNYSNGENTQIKDFLTHHEVDQSIISTDLVTSEQVVNTISNISNLNETCSKKFKLLEDKEIDVFLDLENKKKDTSMESEKTINLSLCNTKTVTKCHNLNNSDITFEIIELDN